MTYSALFLGSIGVLAETSDLQRRAFNRAFAKHGVPIGWAPEAYARLLTKSGGLMRIRTALAESGHAADAEAIYADKQAFFAEAAEKQGLTPRPGVVELVKAADAHGLKVAFVTSTTDAQIDLLFKGLKGALTRGDFDYIGGAHRVDRSKPAPDIYRDALKALGVEASDALAIEDTPESAAAARDAGVPVIGFPGEAAAGRSFEGALDVVDRLDPALLSGPARMAAE